MTFFELGGWGVGGEFFELGVWRVGVWIFAFFSFFFDFVI